MLRYTAYEGKCDLDTTNREHLRLNRAVNRRMDEICKIV